MRLARVTGTVEASIKDAALTGQKLLLCDLIDGGGAVQGAAHVAVDGCGAGTGDTVLLTFGSAARMPAFSAGAPVDATIVAVVDTVTVGSARPTAKTVAKTEGNSAAKSAAKTTATKSKSNETKPKTSRRRKT